MQIRGGTGAGPLGLVGDVVHQIVDLQHVAAGEDPGYAGHAPLVHHGSAGDRVQGHAAGPGQLVFRDQAHGQKQRVAGDQAPGGVDGPPGLVHLGDGHALQTVLAVDLGHGGAEVQGDAEVLQALDDVALESAGVGQKLADGLPPGALQGQAPGHDQADVAGAENDHPLAHQIAFDVHELLGRAGAVNARGPGAADAQCAPAALPAAHGQDHGPGLDFEDAVAVPGRHHPAGCQTGDRGFRVNGDASGADFLFVDGGVFRAGQLPAQLVQAEAVVDALLQNAAGPGFAVENGHVGDAPVVGRGGGGHTGGTAADDNQIMGFHWVSPILPASRPEPGPCFVMVSMGTPSS